MAYVPKRLMIARCWRCGKPIYKGDDAYYCEKDKIYICPTCYKKLHGKCPICQGKLIPV